MARGRGLAGHGDYGYALSLGSDDQFWWDTHSETTRDFLDWGPDNLKTDTWYHVVATWDGTTNTNGKKIYLNGALGDQKTSTISTMGTPNYNFYIGCDSVGNTRFEGAIDEVRVYKGALSASEVEALYKSGLVKVSSSQTDKLTDGLVGMWSFDGPDMADITAYDRSGQGNDGTLTNGPDRTFGKVGQALEFDGVDDYVLVGHSTDYKPVDEMTIAGWMRANDWDVTFDITRTGPTQMRLFAAVGGGNEYPSMYLNFDSAGGTLCQDTLSMDSEQWYYFAGVYDSNDMIVYVNGSEFKRCNVGLDTINQDANDLLIGKSGSNFADGIIDEVRIYNRALSEQEIRRLYNMGR